MLALLQARTTSHRLPGKVLRPILGEPMIGRQIERLQRAMSITRIVVATSVERSDDDLSAYVQSLGVDVFRGPLRDVLSRMYLAADWFEARDDVMRLTADCPLAAPSLIDRCVEAHRRGGADLTFTQDGWTYPKGLDVEVMRLAALRCAWREAEAAYDREHVTSYIHTRPDRFRLRGLPRRRPLALCWTVDTPEDFAFVSAAYAALYPGNPAFTSADVLRWQRRAERARRRGADPGDADDHRLAAA